MFGTAMMLLVANEPASAAAVPRKPVGLGATPLSSSSIRLDWQDTASDERGFWLYVDNVYTAPNLPADTRSVTRTGLQPNTRYCFTVEAYNPTGGSGQSPQACATTPPTVATPSVNWSGHVTKTGSAYQVLGRWRVPTTTCQPTENSTSSQGVGLGGGRDEPAMVQIGIVSACASGARIHQGVTRIRPSQAAAEPFAMIVNPGDNIEAEITYLGRSQYSLRLMNISCWCAPFTATVGQPDLDTTPRTAEWIVGGTTEPVLGQGLTTFGTVHFENAFFNNRLVTAEDTEKFVQVDSSTVPKTTVSDISQYGGRGPNFDVTWLRR